MKRRSTPFPSYTHVYRDRHGKVRCDFRRGSVNLPLPYPLLGAEFWEAYRQALADYVAGRAPGGRSRIGDSRTRAGSVASAFAAYVDSAGFKTGLSESTRRNHFRILRLWVDEYGEHRLSDLQRRHVAQWVDEKGETPASARDFLKALRRLLQYAVSVGLVEADATQGVKPPKQRNRAIHSWSDSEIERFRQHHPLGSTPRLALELLLGTAQRRGDVVRMGRQHLRNGAIHVVQQKTGWEGDIPLTPELARALEAVPPANLTFLVTEAGAPFTPAGFGNAFRDWCNAAGLPRETSAHGLRKACCRILAESGCTASELMAISGHLTMSEATRYTRAVDQGHLARAAMAKRRTAIGEPDIRFSKIVS